MILIYLEHRLKFLGNHTRMFNGPDPMFPSERCILMILKIYHSLYRISRSLFVYVFLCDCCGKKCLNLLQFFLCVRKIAVVLHGLWH